VLASLLVCLLRALSLCAALRARLTTASQLSARLLRARRPGMALGSWLRTARLSARRMRSRAGSGTLISSRRRNVLGSRLVSLALSLHCSPRLRTARLSSRLQPALCTRLRTARPSARLLRSRAMQGIPRSAEDCSPLVSSAAYALHSAEDCSPLSSSAALSCWELHPALSCGLCSVSI
jgi:hypothetical protein